MAGSGATAGDDASQKQTAVPNTTADREGTRAYVLSIGSELIGGHLTDTNATFLAQELAAKGIELLHVIQVGDDLDRLTRTLAAALSTRLTW